MALQASLDDPILKKFNVTKVAAIRSYLGCCFSSDNLRPLGSRSQVSLVRYSRYPEVYLRPADPPLNYRDDRQRGVNPVMA